MRSDRTNSHQSAARHGYSGHYEHEPDATADGSELSAWERDASVIDLRRSRRPQRRVSVLTNRIAAALVNHEPGWQLPRLSVLARQYDSTTEQLTAAISELVGRGLIRRAPGGQFCRASPAHYVLPFGNGLPGLQLRADPTRGELSVKSRSVSRHAVRDDVERALQLASDEPVCTVQVLWAVGGEAAAVTATYLRPELAGALLTETEPGELDASSDVLSLTPLSRRDCSGVAGPSALVPQAVHLEMQQPPRWAAGALALAACERAATITVRYDDVQQGKPAALSVAVLRADLFRISIDQPGAPVQPDDDGLDSTRWSHLGADWEF
jgi:hypothetical protein